jgi:hypothetical protein
MIFINIKHYDDFEIMYYGHDNLTLDEIFSFYFFKTFILSPIKGRFTITQSHHQAEETGKL